MYLNLDRSMLASTAPCYKRDMEGYGGIEIEIEI